MLRRFISLLRHRSPSCRSLRLEPLEQRSMLSLPNVVDLNVSSTQWSSSFVDYLESNNLGTDGYRIPVGTSDQTKTLTWLHIDQIRITFGEDVDVQQADLAVSGVAQTWYRFKGFQYDAATHTAIWTMQDPFAADKLLLDLDADGIDPIRNTAESNLLDGEWINGTSTYASGNGAAGGDFAFRINVAPADSNASALVSSADAALVQSVLGKDTSTPGYNIRCDLDGDGLVEQADFDAVLARLVTGLPGGEPAGVTNDAPTTTGIANFSGNEDDPNHMIDLFAAFGDNENADNQLTYQIVSNSNPSLFASTTVDGAAGTLTLDFAANTFGTATLIVRATDTGGLSVETALTVDVAAVNDAPTTTGLPDVVVGVNAANSTIDLFAAFADIENADSQMSYEIVGNTNPSLFTSTAINGTEGTLTLDFADNTAGSATLTVRATDTNGATVDATMAVTANQAPRITSFICVNTYSTEWLILGSVSDPDDDLVGRTLTFGGVLEPFNITAVVQADGSFTVTRFLDGLQEGMGTATITDQHGASGSASYWLYYS